MASAVMWTVVALRADARKVDDSWSPSDAVLFWARFWDAVYGIPWPLHLAVLHNEGASTPRAPHSAELDALQDLGETPELVYPVGDLTVAVGPSFGSGQVTRANLEKLFAAAPIYLKPLLSVPTLSHLALPGYERQALWASAQVLKQALVDAGGDEHDASRRYNGSGPRAEAYADAADPARQALEGGGSDA